MSLTIRRALVSVSDKTGVVELGQALAAAGVEILSTGCAFRALQEAGIAVVEVAAHTGFPEMMDGRVKTLHPKIHGGILGRRGTDEDVMEANDIAPIDLIVVNLYPFAATIARDDCTDDMAIENIDIGGPAMVRSGAKNHASVLTVTDPADYDEVIQALGASAIDAAMQRAYAVKAFRHTAQYDATVAEYLGANELMPDSLTLTYTKADELRYGENLIKGRLFIGTAGQVVRELSPTTSSCRARSFLITTLQIPMRRWSVSKSLMRLPASSSSTPIPVVLVLQRALTKPTTKPLPRIRPRPLAASLLSTSS